MVCVASGIVYYCSLEIVESNFIQMLQNLCYYSLGGNLVYTWCVITGAGGGYSQLSPNVVTNVHEFYNQIFTILLFCSGFELSTWRIPGVLQRFAASYFVVALTEMLSVPVYAKASIDSCMYITVYKLCA